MATEQEDGMIDPKAQPIGHREPLKRVDLAARRQRKPVITRYEVENGLEPMPDPELYELDYLTDSWRLKP